MHCTHVCIKRSKVLSNIINIAEFRKRCHFHQSQTLSAFFASDDSEDPSLLLNRDLINMIRLKTNRDMSMAALQGRYWCEVWDTRSNVAETVDAPIRRRSNSYDIRFSGLMSILMLP